MMQDRYSLTPGQARWCRYSAVFLWIAAALAALTWPVFWYGIGGTWLLSCDTEIGCGFTIDRAAMLPDELAETLRASPADLGAYEIYLHQPGVRALLTLLVTIRILPYVALFACTAIALNRLGTERGSALATAFPWLKRAGIGALGVAVLPPLVDMMRGAIVTGGLPGFDRMEFHFDFDMPTFGLNLLIALTLLSVAWALEAGTRAARDMDEFV